MLALAESSHAVLPAELDRDPWSLNVANGTIDLRSGNLRPHKREDMITKIVPVDFDPDARSALWESFLDTITGGNADLAAYIGRAIGCALVGEASEKSFWFCYGPPDGAKSTFIDAVAGTLGDYHLATSPDTWLVQSATGGNRGDIVRLLGRRFVTAVEFKHGARFDVALVKSVTGGDAITAAAKYTSEVTFKPSFALWFAANDCPAIRDDDAGMWKRVRRIPFTNVIEPKRQDREMRSKLGAPDVQRAILAWAVRGCLEWQRSGLGSCDAVDCSSAAYREEMDRVALFFVEECEFGAGLRISASAVRGAYEAWCKNNGVRSPLSRTEFAERLRERQCVEGKSGPERFWRGIALSHGT